MVAWGLLAIVVGIAVIASLISVRIGVSVAIVEIVLGIVAGNAFGVSGTGQDWLPFLAGVGSVVLTFLAGAEIDPEAMRRTWRASLAIGFLSFIAPFLTAWWFADLILRWSFEASLLTGVALSTTSVAVVYVVLIETGLSRAPVGKLILSACFVTDLGTAIALSLLFAPPNVFILLLLAAIVIATIVGPPVFRWVFRELRDRGGEIEIRSLLFVVVLLGALAQLAGSEAVLPAYILGLALASSLAGRKEAVVKLRSLTFSFLTPFFFISAGLNVSLTAVVAGLGLVLALFGVKVAAKFAGVVPAVVRFVGRDSVYISLLMSTGLTFGTISALFGLNAGIIDRFQFSIILEVVISTAIVPTLIAQRWFSPEVGGPEAEG